MEDLFSNAVTNGQQFSNQRLDILKIVGFKSIYIR